VINISRIERASPVTRPPFVTWPSLARRSAWPDLISLSDHYLRTLHAEVTAWLQNVISTNRAHVLLQFSSQSVSQHLGNRTLKPTPTPTLSFTGQLAGVKVNKIMTDRWRRPHPPFKRWLKCQQRHRVDTIRAFYIERVESFLFKFTVQTQSSINFTSLCSLRPSLISSTGRKYCQRNMNMFLDYVSITEWQKIKRINRWTDYSWRTRKSWCDEVWRNNRKTKNNIEWHCGRQRTVEVVGSGIYGWMMKTQWRQTGTRYFQMTPTQATSPIK